MNSLNRLILEKALLEDKEFQLLSKKCNFSFVWQIGQLQMFFSVNHGNLKIISSLTFNDYWDFTIKGTRESWNEFFQPFPKPFYHELFAMINQVKDVTLDGNRLKAMQHIRCLSRMFHIFRIVSIKEKGEYFI